MLGGRAARRVLPTVREHVGGCRIASPPRRQASAAHSARRCEVRRQRRAGRAARLSARLPAGGNPPLLAPARAQATAALSRALGQQLYRLDCWLEEQGVLREIRPALPKSVAEGGLSEQELEVGCGAHSLLPLPLSLSFSLYSLS